jgi:hypothetical protein
MRMAGVLNVGTFVGYFIAIPETELAQLQEDGFVDPVVSWAIGV